jgi:hypothetical protein
VTSALAIASVTYLLKDLLDNRLVQHGITASVGDVTVTALPPDRITTGTDERSQINLFLYRVTPHTAWRGGLSGPEENGAHAHRATLALDLHYLITAYGERDFQAEILLGSAMQLLLETPVISREMIRTALPAGKSGRGGNLPPLQQTLATAELAEQVDEIRLIPEFLSTEEASRLWSALQAKYRPSASYKVSTVYIEANR